LKLKRRLAKSFDKWHRDAEAFLGFAEMPQMRQSRCVVTGVLVEVGQVHEPARHQIIRQSEQLISRLGLVFRKLPNR
jgi:hypothetical protein